LTLDPGPTRGICWRTALQMERDLTVSIADKQGMALETKHDSSIRAAFDFARSHQGGVQ
ncbi:unnamed protein product, partial [Allacma fusca]